MTLAELRTSLQARGYGSDTAAAQNELLNSVYRRIAGMRRWAWLESLTTGLVTTVNQPSVSLTPIASLMWVDAVRLELGTQYYDVAHMPIQELREHEHTDRTPSVPLYWTEAFGELRFWPRPDKAYTVTLDYINTPPNLTGDTDRPLFDSTYHDVLVWGAVADMAARQRDWNAVANAKQEYTSALKEMIGAYSIKQRQASDTVGSSNFWQNASR